MAKTGLGCQTLHEKGHFPEFALFIRQHGHEKEDSELILKLKSILWTVVRCIFHVFFPLLSRIGKYRFFRLWPSVPRGGGYHPCDSRNCRTIASIVCAGVRDMHETNDFD
jgi:hypothetical protein